MSDYQYLAKTRFIAIVVVKKEELAVLEDGRLQDKSFELITPIETEGEFLINHQSYDSLNAFIDKGLYISMLEYLKRILLFIEDSSDPILKEFIKKIHAIAPFVPIILFSKSPINDSQKRCSQMKANFYIEFPCDAVHLLTVARKAISKLKEESILFNAIEWENNLPDSIKKIRKNSESILKPMRKETIYIWAINTELSIDQKSLQDKSGKEISIIRLDSERKAIDQYTTYSYALLPRVILMITEKSLKEFSVAQFIEEARQTYAAVQILVLTSDISIFHTKELLSFGADDCISLTAASLELESCIEKAIHRLQYNQFFDRFDKWDKNLLETINTTRKKIILKKRKLQRIAGHKISSVPLEDAVDLPNLKSILEADTNTQAPDRRKESILLVEDEEEVRQRYYYFLKNQYDVYQAGSGQEALDKIKSSPIDIVLLDMMLPDTLGSDLIPHLRVHNPQIDIVILTAYKDKDYAINTLREGAFDFINKPILKENLLATIQHVSDKRYYSKILFDLILTLKNSLSFQYRLSLLEEFLIKQHNKGVLFADPEDIMFFFPELQIYQRLNSNPQLNMPIPSNLKGNTLQNYIMRLIEQQQDIIEYNLGISLI